MIGQNWVPGKVNNMSTMQYSVIVHAISNLGNDEFHDEDGAEDKIKKIDDLTS